MYKHVNLNATIWRKKCSAHSLCVVHIALINTQKEKKSSINPMCQNIKYTKIHPTAFRNNHQSKESTLQKILIFHSCSQNKQTNKQNGKIYISVKYFIALKAQINAQDMFSAR